MENRTEQNDSSNRQILEAVDVEVPVEDAYAQWTQLEEFPQFMQNVERVRQHGDRRMSWHVNLLGNEQEWTAEITEQVPNKRIAWRSTSGAEHAGVVTFHRLSDTGSRVTVQIDYAPQGLVEHLGDRLGVVSHGVRRDLESFKRFIEGRGAPTGAWKGRIRNPDERITPTGPGELASEAAGAAGRS